ncbi:MAG: hypothetical protein ABJC89_16395, partial [Acidobacteriota bacterium]
DQRIVIHGQERQDNQRELAIRFDVHARGVAGRIGRPALLMGVFTALLLIGRWRRYGATAVVGAMTLSLGMLLMASPLAATVAVTSDFAAIQ